MRSSLFCGALVAIAAASPAYAEDSPICTDRPGKANAVCTVLPGKFQLETGLGSWSRIESGGTKTDIWQVGGSLLKYGLSDRSDLQFGFTPYIELHSGPSRSSGIGDLTVRYRHRLTPEGARVQLAAIPFVKLPTARHGIGNGKVEGGLAVPVSLATGGLVTVVLGPELDLLADSDGSGRHVQLVNLINVSGLVAPRLTLIAELWTGSNFDPAGTVTQMSADAALAYAVDDKFQLDAGANTGLNRHTPDIELYAGFSIRF